MTAQSAIAGASAPEKSPAALEWRIVLAVVLVLCGAFLVLYPLFSLALTSFQTNVFGEDVTWGWTNWSDVFAQRRLTAAVWNTLALSATRQALSIVLGVLLAWLIARSNLPGARWLEVGFWIALFMPALPVALSWVFLLGGRTGVINAAYMKLPFATGPLFDIYSWWGIVLVHMLTATTAVKVFLLTPAFRAMDSNLEEAARAGGASLATVLRRIVAPLMAPTILVVFLIGLIRAMQAFEVELILGAPKNIDVYSTVIYRQMMQEPPKQGLASALAVLFFATIIPLVVLQQWAARRNAHAVVSGKAQQRLFDLGRWRWPVFGAVIALLTLMTVVPFVCLLLATFMKMFGNFDMAEPWTLENWTTALGSGQILAAFWNSLRLGGVAAACGMILFSLTALTILRAPPRWGRALDLLTWAPSLIPGLVLSLGFLQTFTGLPFFRPLYGTLAVLVIAVLVSTATIGVQIVRAALVNVGRELEEAAWMSGATRATAVRRIVLPLVAPAIAVVGLEIFATANAAVGVIALIGVGDTQPLSILQLVLLESGDFEAAAVVGVLIMTLTVASALLARRIGERLRAGA